MNKPEQLTQWADSLKGADPERELTEAMQALADALALHYGITYARVTITPKGAFLEGSH